jgi:hypothetical protein
MRSTFENIIGWAFNNPTTVMIIILLMRLSILGLIIWAAIHFITKYW